MESTGVPTRAAGGECSDGIGSTTAEGERPEKPFLAPAAALGKEACTLVQEGLVGGDGFAVDASVIKADANRSRSTAREGADLRTRITKAGTIIYHGDLNWRRTGSPRQKARPQSSNLIPRNACGDATALKPRGFQRHWPEADGERALPILMLLRNLYGNACSVPRSGIQ